MQNLKILNSKDVKKIVKELEEIYGSDLKNDYAFFQNNDGKIFLLSKKFGELDEKSLRINNLGMYFGKFEKDGIRLNIEGAQLINAKKNIFEMKDADVQGWIRGEDLVVGNMELKHYLIMKNGDDVYGVGKYKDGKIMNYTSKDRRIKSADI